MAGTPAAGKGVGVCHGTSICQHEILGTLKMPQKFLSHFPVALTMITQVLTQHANSKSNIKACAYLSIHQATHN